MLIPRTFAELEERSEADLRAAYDEIGSAGYTVESVSFILREIDRKRSDRRERRMLAITWWIAVLTLVNVVLVAIALAK
jgi:hypothetical protein